MSIFIPVKREADLIRIVSELVILLVGASPILELQDHPSVVG